MNIGAVDTFMKMTTNTFVSSTLLSLITAEGVHGGCYSFHGEQGFQEEAEISLLRHIISKLIKRLSHTIVTCS